MKTKRITIADIAQKSGYSKTAVSFAFNCPERISRDAVERILAVAKEMDYIPDPMARNFSLGRHFSIGFLVPQAFATTLGNPHTIEVLKGIGKVCEGYDYTLTLIPPIHASIAEAVRNATVDGIIAMGLEFGEEMQEALKRRRLPYVCIDGIDEKESVSVSTNNRAAARTQMTEVLLHGHRSIGVISLEHPAYLEKEKGNVSPGVAQERLSGYQEALQSVGQIGEFPMIEAPTTEEGGYQAAMELLKDTSLTCLVCMSDVHALGAIAAIKASGLRCPEDISVIGFDGIENSAGLTTIKQNGEEKGRMATEILFQEIKGQEEVSGPVEVSYTFIEGSTLKSLT